jgi:hypothetical protein
MSTTTFRIAGVFLALVRASLAYSAGNPTQGNVQIIIQDLTSNLVELKALSSQRNSHLAFSGNGKLLFQSTLSGVNVVSVERPNQLTTAPYYKRPQAFALTNAPSVSSTRDGALIALCMGGNGLLVGSVQIEETDKGNTGRTINWRCLIPTHSPVFEAVFSREGRVALGKVPSWGAKYGMVQSCIDVWDSNRISEWPNAIQNENQNISWHKQGMVESGPVWDYFRAYSLSYSSDGKRILAAGEVTPVEREVAKLVSTSEWTKLSPQDRVDRISQHNRSRPGFLNEAYLEMSKGKRTGIIRVFDLATGRKLAESTSPENMPIICARFIGDSENVVAVSGDFDFSAQEFIYGGARPRSVGNVHIVAELSKNAAWTKVIGSHGASAVSLSGNGRHLVMGKMPNTGEIWSIGDQTAENKRGFKSPATIRDIAVSEDGTRTAFVTEVGTTHLLMAR